jgi:hypothetical protein
MGRPIPKKYFGNRNVGSASTTADNGLGGKQVASVTLGTLGSYTVRPTVTFSDPDLLGAGAVRAAGTVTSEVLSAAISGTQTRAYPIAAGAISFAGGTTAATFTAAVTSDALTTVAYASATTIGFDTTTVAMISGTSIHITGASITGTMTIGGVAIAAGQIYYVGSPTGATAATLYATYADAQAATAPLTISNGTTTGATFTRGVTHGTVTALTVVTRGSYEALVASGPAVVSTAGVGEGLTITPTYRANAVVITEQGSGYADATDAAASFTQSVTGTSVLEADSGAPGSETNQENAIAIYAYLPAVSTAGYISGAGGSSRVLGDIVRQSGNNKYVVETAQGVGVVRLQTDGSAANAAGEADITATDWNGSTYRVVKLHAKKARLKQVTSSTAFLIDDLTWAQWTLSAATGTVVTIANI